jgi:hypothetical protein
MELIGTKKIEQGITQKKSETELRWKYLQFYFIFHSNFRTKIHNSSKIYLKF